MAAIIQLGNWALRALVSA